MIWILRKKPLLAFVVSLAAFLLVCIASQLTPTCRAGVLDDKLKELEEMQKDIEELTSQIEARKSTEKSLLGELERLEAQMKLAEKELAYIEARTQYLNDRMAETKREIEVIERQLADQKSAFNARLVSMYKAGQMSYVEVLLGANSMSDFLTRLRYLKDIASYDAQLIEEYMSNQKQLMAKKESLEKDLASLGEAKREQEIKRASVASRSQDRERYLASIQSERQKLEQALDEMERQSRELEKVIQELQAQGHKPEKKALSMIRPVSGGWISSYYGNRLHPILGYYRFHSGIDIAVDSGVPIKAAEDGTVIFAGSNGGYGNCVIIDHGGGISTLYAHASRILVQKGQDVRKGQTVALVGTTGLSTGPHLHFEVRIDGKTDDPLKWLP